MPTRSGTAVADTEGDPWRLIDRDSAPAPTDTNHAADDRERSRPQPREGSQTSWGEYAPAVARWERTFGERAPDPLDGRGRLNVDLTRWMLGFPPGWHGDLSRTAALRGYGNAVQVQVAELVARWALSQ